MSEMRPRCSTCPASAVSSRIVCSSRRAPCSAICPRTLATVATVSSMRLISLSWISAISTIIFFASSMRPESSAAPDCKAPMSVFAFSRPVCRSLTFRRIICKRAVRNQRPAQACLTVPKCTTLRACL
jgi:hypothetical protein